MNQSDRSKPLTVLRPSRGLPALGLADLWHHRDLLYIFCWRDITVRYKQTLLGMTWAMLVPFVTMVVFSLLFGKLAKMPSDGLPYPIFVFAGLLPWQLFARALSESGNSIVGNQALIKKVFFPRLIIPFSAVLPGVVDFAIGMLVLFGMMAFYGITPGWGIITLPLLVLYGVVAALAPGLWLAVLNVDYRDIRQILPFLVQLWFFATPVVYPGSAIGEPWRTLMGINPMVGVVEGMRWALLGAAPPHAGSLMLSMSATGVLLVGGLYFFRLREPGFADRV